MKALLNKIFPTKEDGEIEIVKATQFEVKKRSENYDAEAIEKLKSAKSNESTKAAKFGTKDPFQVEPSRSKSFETPQGLVSNGLGSNSRYTR